jgi:Contractile injection system tube protein
MVTKGSLETTEGEKITVKFNFNPKEYSISKSNTWSAAEANRGSDTPPLHFGGGQPKQLKLQLLFDTFEAGTDVRRDYTDNLFKMMEINPKLPEGGTTKTTGSPPKLKFSWGTVWSFFCYLESLSVQFTLFLADGTPVRANADLGLKQAVDEKQQPGTNPSSAGEGGEHIWLVQPQDRLDLIAFHEYGDASRWRVISDANGITDPLKIVAGQRLIIPATPVG